MTDYVIVQDSSFRDLLLDKFQSNNLITQIGDTAWILGKPVDEFIHVAEIFSEDFWASPKTKVGGTT